MSEFLIRVGLRYSLDPPFESLSNYVKYIFYVVIAGEILFKLKVKLYFYFLLFTIVTLLKYLYICIFFLFYLILWAIAISNEDKFRGSLLYMHFISILENATFIYYNYVVVRQYSSKINNDNKLDPWYVTGFADGEGCFNILVVRSKSNLIGWQIQPRFVIEVNIKDIDLLLKVKDFFGGIGSVTTTKSVARFAVYGFKDIVNVILKHFEDYPLQSAKQIDYYFWRECINLMLEKKHLTLEGLTEVISNKFTMNFGESEKLKESFPNATPKKRFVIDCNNIYLNPFWVTGFIEAEGSFYITENKNTSVLRPWFSIGMNVREKFLLVKLNEFFNNIGSVYENPCNRSAELKVFKLASFDSLKNHFNNHPLQGFKGYNFSIWSEILKLLSDNNQKNIEKIKELRGKLNKWK